MTCQERIKYELSKKGLTQKALCELTNISEANMSKYLINGKNLRGDILAKISKALNVSVSELLGLEDKEGTTYDICKTALLARKGSTLTEEEKKELINLIFDHD